MPKKSKNEENLNLGNEKIAFVISPIGEPSSAIRKRADQILNHVIIPIVSELGYKAVRADKISKPGVITSQIINHILDDPLVVADLTGQNPNVFYELAVRHTVKKPTIQMIQEGERIPFDVSTTRTISINHQDLDSVERAKEELRKQIGAVEKDPTLVDSPISMAVDLKGLKQSADPESKALAELKASLQEMQYMIQEIFRFNRTQYPSTIYPQIGHRGVQLEDLQDVLGTLGNSYVYQGDAGRGYTVRTNDGRIYPIRSVSDLDAFFKEEVRIRRHGKVGTIKRKARKKDEKQQKKETT